MDNENKGQFIFVDHGVNLQQVISEYIYQNFNTQLPDLTNLVIFVPAPDLIYTFRKSLLAYLSSQKISAIIGAEISPLKKWIEANISLMQDDKTFINNHCRQLIILEALQQYPAHFENENLWQVSAALLQLFDELSLNNLNPSAMGQSEWIEKLKTLYNTPSDPEHLSNEARLIYTLWHAWQQQLDDEQLLDQTSVYVQRLQNISADEIKNKQFIIAGAEKLSRNEIHLIKSISSYCPVHFFIQANSTNIKNALHPDYVLDDLIKLLDFKTSNSVQLNTSNSVDYAFQHQLPLKERIKNTKTNKHLKVFSAVSEEHEASAVDLQVRQWLLAGKRNIAVVTENRKLARRVRALLERAGVNLVDSVGWSLSTTNAASVVERWLECIEQDFASITFLDFLKSPFFHDTQSDKNLLEDIYRFEKDVVYHEQIKGNIQRYLNALQYRKNRLGHWENNCYENIYRLLNEIDAISAPLFKLFNSNKTTATSKYLQILSDSLTKLGLSTSLLQCEAGENVLAEITHMLNACDAANPDMSWSDFRTWLGNSFENHHYSPSSAASHVRLLNLTQSNSGYYDGLIIASADATQLPGAAPKTPFFNHHVRHSLGLPDWQQKKAEQYYLFRRLLQSADETLISYCAEKDNEIQQASPWLQTILDAYPDSDSINASTLTALLKSEQTSVLDSINIDAPELTMASAPVIGNNDIPEDFSSSKHQRLINCPYQFFSNDILKLTAPEELVLELQKSEYGQKVHKILELFHLSEKPEHDFEQSLQLLQKISKKIFKRDIEDNFLHRGWLKRWLDHCESYLKWQQHQQEEWSFHAAEKDQNCMLSDHIKLKGRIDRIDKKDSEFGIIDYKTSSKTPSQTDVETGEDIQLSSYALLLDNVNKVEYLKLDESSGKVSSGASLTDTELNETTLATQKRFTQIITEVEKGTGLNANGSDDICQFCRMSGICRKDFWKLNQ